jgi:hypothetical protein
MVIGKICVKNLFLYYYFNIRIYLKVELKIDYKFKL